MLLQGKELNYGLLISNWKVRVIAATTTLRFTMEQVLVQVKSGIGSVDLPGPVTRFLLATDCISNGDPMIQNTIRVSRLVANQNVSILRI